MSWRRHWTPRYLRDRAVAAAVARRHPDWPWLNRYAVRQLDRLLDGTQQAVEFGSGRSTLWLASRVESLQTVEHDPAWAEAVRAQLAAAGHTHVTLRACPVTPEHDPAADRRTDSAAAPAYARVLADVADASLDLVLVDGAHRDWCALLALAKLRPGGVLVLDDAHGFLPSASRAPGARRPSEGPRNARWAAVAAAVADWQTAWLGDGVKDTAFFWAPGGAAT